MPPVKKKLAKKKKIAKKRPLGYSRTIACCYCKKKTKIEISSPAFNDIKHVIEMIIELEKKGWTSTASLYQYDGMTAKIQCFCDACSIKNNNDSV